MANRWKIPPDMETEIRLRDRACLYCAVVSGTSEALVAQRPKHERMKNKRAPIMPETIVSCYRAYASPKRQKTLAEWLASPASAQRGSSLQTPAPVALGVAA